MNAKLAGLDARDVVTARHPWLHQAAGATTLAALPARPRSWPEVLAAMPEAAGAATEPQVGADAAWDAARRLREASFTPAGERQPSEIAGVDASARVPNQGQPMAGEMAGGREVRDGRPAFFGSLMPPPTGVANGVGVPEGRVHPFGAPLGMTRSAGKPVGSDRLALAALGGVSETPVPPGPAALAAMPHFAGGGDLGAGGDAVIGEDGPELLHTGASGGAEVTPLPQPQRNTAALAALTPTPWTPAAGVTWGGATTLPARDSGAAAATPTDFGGTADGAAAARLAREASGYSASNYGTPPEEHGARDAYLAAVRSEQAAPDPNASQYSVPGWRKALGIAGEVATDLFAPRLAKTLGPLAYGGIAGRGARQYARDAQTWERQNAAEKEQTPQLAQAARMEQQQNAQDLGEYDRAQRAQDATADYRAQQLAREQQQTAATEAERLAEQQATGAYRKDELALDRARQNRTGVSRQPNPTAINQRYTQQAIANALASHGGRDGAEA
ncbi:MAG: hypothetical protein ACRD1C_03735 [Terriglobales bacterium]